MPRISELMLRVATPEYGHVVIETSDGVRHHTDLSSFSAVYCFPKTKDEWDRVTPDSHGLALVWSSRFEVHVDQVMALEYRRETLERTA